MLTRKKSLLSAPAGAALAAVLVLAGCSPTVPLNQPLRRAPVIPAALPAPAMAPAPAASQPAPAETFPVGEAPAASAVAPAASAGGAQQGPATPGAPPYGEAVAARFPAPAVRYDTPGAREDRADFTTQAELTNWLHRLAETPRAAGAGAVRLLDLGRSQRGVALEALLFSRERSSDAAALARIGRPTVLLIAGQHGDEPAGTEALLVIARELAEGRLNALLDRINVVVVPRANPDGALIGQRFSANGSDINRDHLLLSTPEAQALARLGQDYQPVLVTDAHEYNPFAPWVQKFGAVQRYDALLQYAMTPNLPPFVTRAAEEWFRRPLVDALANERLANEWYYTTSDDLADKLVSMGGVVPDTARNVSGLRNAVGFLIETRGIGLGKLHLQRRIHTHVTALKSLLASAASRAADLVKLRGYVEAAVASRACQGEAVVAAAETRSEHNLVMLDPVSGVDKPVTVDWNSALDLQPRTTRARPCGYWLGADAGDAVRRLRALGLQVQRIEANTSAQGDEYRREAPVPSPVRLVDALIDMPAGSFYVPLTQPLANLAIAALEPDAPGGYVAQGVLPGLADVARVRVPPQAQLTALP
jgi:hypothetical protein